MRGRADVSYTWRRWVGRYGRYCRCPRRLSGGPAGSHCGARHRRSAAPASNSAYLEIVHRTVFLSDLKVNLKQASLTAGKRWRKKVTFVFPYFPQYSMKKLFNKLPSADLKKLFTSGTIYLCNLGRSRRNLNRIRVQSSSQSRIII
jgi:hypothetical protein